jgi:hypothetical protein
MMDDRYLDLELLDKAGQTTSLRAWHGQPLLL